MILNITDENWAEVIEDTLTVETFTEFKRKRRPFRVGFIILDF